ncbi:hypothetical protein [Amycolatopsis sp. lyj-346]|uniref:hypothetical protein n=1 Tax=Amycolatopsis sp. lyj-346 TaxID=2789289 RepID=UPI00397B56D0
MTGSATGSRGPGGCHTWWRATARGAEPGGLARQLGGELASAAVRRGGNLADLTRQLGGKPTGAAVRRGDSPADPAPRRGGNPVGSVRWSSR